MGRLSRNNPLPSRHEGHFLKCHGERNDPDQIAEVGVLEEDYPFINKEAKRFADTQEERKRLSEEEMKRLIQFGCNVHETTDDDGGD